MDAIADGLLYVFYAATIAALGFFIHKVLWLVQYKRLQSAIVAEAVRRLDAGNARDLADWEEFAGGRWALVLGKGEISGPSTFIRRVEEGLGQVRADLRRSRRSLEELFARALASAKGNAEPPVTVLSLRRLTRKGADERYDVTVDLRFPPLIVPRAPDRKLYELKVASRYGVVRRALVFFSGAADVFYSSQHVARMSQNVHVPTSTLVRRLSLVFLVLFFVFLDLGFQIRRHISAAIEAALLPSPAPHAGHHAGARRRRRSRRLRSLRGHRPRLRGVAGHLRIDLARLLFLHAPPLPEQRAPTGEAPGGARRDDGQDPPRPPRRALALGRRVRAQPGHRGGPHPAPRRGAHRSLRPPPPPPHRRARACWRRPSRSPTASSSSSPSPAGSCGTRRRSTSTRSPTTSGRAPTRWATRSASRSTAPPGRSSRWRSPISAASSPTRRRRTSSGAAPPRTRPSSPTCSPAAPPRGCATPTRRWSPSASPRPTAISASSTAAWASCGAASASSSRRRDPWCRAGWR